MGCASSASSRGIAGEEEQGCGPVAREHKHRVALPRLLQREAAGAEQASAWKGRTRDGKACRIQDDGLQQPSSEACHGGCALLACTRTLSHANSAPAFPKPPSAGVSQQSDEEVVRKASSGSASGGSASGREKARGKAAQRRRLRSSKTVPASFYEGSHYNGFKTVPELPALSCSEDLLSPFSLPQEALVRQPTAEEVITTFRNGDRERKIHNNTRLTAAELDQLSAMRGEAKAQGLAFSPSVTSMATRFLSRARGDPIKAVKFMKETQDWREQHFADGPVTAEQVREDLRHGIVYFTGRDYALRPAIVVRAARIPKQWYKDRSIDKFIRLLVFCMEYFLRYMTVPGRLENLSVIVDLQGLGLSQVPLGPLGEVYKVMSHHYIGRVYKFYVCNMSTALGAIAGMARGFLTDRQKQKLNILDDVRELRKEFALHQLEEDLGGSRPAVSQFFPFRLGPGPYGAGFAGEPAAAASSAAPDAHGALSARGAWGRLWDPKVSEEENRRLDFEPRAVSILERCGLPIPPELLLELETPIGSHAGKCFPAARQSSREATISSVATGSENGTASSNVDEAAGAPFDFADVGVDEVVPRQSSFQNGGVASCACCGA